MGYKSSFDLGSIYGKYDPFIIGTDNVKELKIGE
jgi:hypothetical protein